MVFGRQTSRLRPASLRRPLVGGALALPIVVIGASVFVAVRGNSAAVPVMTPPPAPAPPAAVVVTVRPLGTSTVEFPPDEDATASLDTGASTGVSTAPPADEGPALDDDGEPWEPQPPSAEPPPKPAAPRHFATVREAARGSCTTASIEGLSQQIIDEARCLDPSALAPLPSRPNLVTGPHVFAYLQADARKHLLKVLDAHKGTTLTVHSALRSVAQQYLVWKWSMTKTCGVELATPPGKSSHELGLALDIADHASWRGALEAEKFHWLGTTDKVHFDFQAPETAPHKMVDVLAFQRLWNRNHPTDRIAETGVYGPPTEQRLESAPADGFKVGAVCKSGVKRAL